MHFNLALLLPISAAVALPSFLRPRLDDSCDYTGSNTPVFYLPSISYSSQIVYSTPAHMAVSSARLEFGLINSVEYTTNLTCSGYDGSQTSSGAFFAWAYSRVCSTPAGYGAIGAANFSYTGYDHQVTINETWSCGGETYLGTASKKLPLQCKQTNWKNGNWTPGSLYTTEYVDCQPLSAFLVAQVTKLED